MKLKAYSILLSLLLVGSLMLASAHALINDNQQPIHISSTQQAVDMVTNTVTMSGDVMVKRGSIDIRADKIIITRPNGKEVVDGYGNPVSFCQLQDNGKSVCGHSLKIRYDTANDLVILVGNAYLEQFDSNVKGNRITYFLKQQQMEAFGDKGEQVTTVLVPAQLQDKTVTNASQIIK